MENSKSLSTVNSNPPSEQLTCDAACIFNRLISVAPKCLNLGLQLGLEHYRIRIIEKDNSKCEDQLREIIATRLAQLPPLTWPAIISALRANCLKETRLAKEIECMCSCSSSLDISSVQSVQNTVFNQSKSISAEPHRQQDLTMIPKQSLVEIATGGKDVLETTACVKSDVEQVSTTLLLKSSSCRTEKIEQPSETEPELVLAYLQHCVSNNSDVISWTVERKRKAIDLILRQKNIEHHYSNTLDSSSLGYSIANSQCQWVLVLDKNKERWRWGEDEKKEDEEISREYLRQLATACRANQRGKVVGLVGAFLSVQSLDIIFNKCKSVLHLQQLSLALPTSCDRISWSDLSALRVLVLGIRRKKTMNWQLGKLLSNISLESLSFRYHRHNDNTSSVCYGESHLVLEDCKAVAELFTHSRDLKEMCSNVAMAQQGMEVIAEVLASNLSLRLERLQLKSKSTFTDSAADNLEIFVTHNTTLKSFYLDISDNTITAHGYLALARAIYKNKPQLEWCLVKGKLLVYVIGDAQANDFAQLLEYYDPNNEDGVNWTDLEIRKISDVGARALAKALHINSTLETLDLSNNIISDVGVVALAQALRNNSNLRELNISNSCVSDAGAVAIAQMLTHNPTLEKLDLSNNDISSIGTGDVTLARALCRNVTLKELNLSKNCINDTGAVALAQALCHGQILGNSDIAVGAKRVEQEMHRNFTLKNLDISSNSISATGAELVAKALHYNPTLEELYLYDNVIGDVGAMAIAQALHHNSALRILDSSHNHVSDDGVVAIAEALHQNSILEELDLSNNNISDTGTEALGLALIHNSTLKKLDLSGNYGINERGTYQLVRALKVNPSITTHGLILSTKCEKCAVECSVYSTVRNRIWFN